MSRKKKVIENNIRAVYSRKPGHENEVVSYEVEVKTGKRGEYKRHIRTIKLCYYKNKELALLAARRERDKILEAKENGLLDVEEQKPLSEDPKNYRISYLFEQSLIIGMHSEGTNIDHRKVYNRHIKPYANMDIRNVTVATIQKTIHDAAPTNKKTSLSRILTIWRSIYEAADNLGLKVEDITKRVKIKIREEVIDDNPDDYAIVKDEDLKFFLEVLNGHGVRTLEKNYERYCFNNMILIGAATGCRPSELTALSKQCITLHEEEGYASIHICKAVGSSVNKKLTLVTPKNKYSDRYVYVEGDAYEVLKEAIAFTKYDLLFTKYDGSLMDSTFVSNHINNISDKCKKLGRDFKFSLYGLRKTFATKMAEKVSPQVLMRMMGHNNIETTYKYYVKVDQESIKNAFIHSDK